MYDYYLELVEVDLCGLDLCILDAVEGYKALAIYKAHTKAIAIFAVVIERVDIIPLGKRYV